MSIVRIQDFHVHRGAPAHYRRDVIGEAMHFSVVQTFGAVRLYIDGEPYMSGPTGRVWWKPWTWWQGLTVEWFARRVP